MSASILSRDSVEEQNQCDGCRAGVPVDKRGFHRMGKPGGYSNLMYCQAYRYGKAPAAVAEERQIGKAVPMKAIDDGEFT